MTAPTRAGTAMVTLPTDEQILITREFNAPKHLVYRVWTTPELIKRWWSGGMGEVTSVEVDLRVGGRWRYVMVAEGGFEVAFHGEFREIVPDERIVNTEVLEDAAGDQSSPEAEVASSEYGQGGVLNTVTFTDVKGRTILRQLVQAPDKETRDLIINSGMESGMQGQMDRIEHLAVSLR